MEISEALPTPPEDQRIIDQRIAERLGKLRSERGWSLEEVARRSEISRATLSRIERAELSPTAAMLGKLCSLYGWTLSRLMVEAEEQPASLLRAGEQPRWKDPETGYRRRAVSPPGPGLRGELMEVQLPPGAVVRYESSPVPGLEHHLWMIEGAVEVEVAGKSFAVGEGDSLRYLLTGSSGFTNSGARPARYVIAIFRS